MGVDRSAELIRPVFTVVASPPMPTPGVKLAPARWSQARKHQFLQPAYSPSHIVVVSLSEPCPEPAVCRQELMWIASPRLALLNANLVANLSPQLIWCFFPNFCRAANILSAGASHRSEHLHTQVELIAYVEFIECFHG